MRSKLKELAEKGILVAISGSLYRDLKSADVQRARAFIKDFTRHNDKLGFDFDVKTRQYKVSKSRQFSGSAYPEFLKSAKVFH